MDEELSPDNSQGKSFQELCDHRVQYYCGLQ